MTLTEKECSEALCDLYNRIYGEEHSYEKEFDILSNLIEAFFSNSPLTYKELKEDMLIWDNKTKKYIQVYEKGEESEWFTFRSIGCVIIKMLAFETNRFYRKEVKDAN